MMKSEIASAKPAQPKMYPRIMERDVMCVASQSVLKAVLQTTNAVYSIILDAGQELSNTMCSAQMMAL